MDDERRFLDNLDRWGAALDRWPERERNAALALLARSERARALLRAAEELDRDLASAMPAAHTDRMRRAILGALPAPQASLSTRRGVWTWWLGWAGGLGAAAASLLVSFYLGAAFPAVWPESGDPAADEELGVDSIILGFGFDGDSL
jgi:hypothetical protein